MDWLVRVDWQRLVVPTNSVAEIVLRGTVTYILLFLVLRFFLKRQTGVIGIADLLVVVLVADAAQSAMAGGYESITEGILLVGTIAFWNYALDWLGYHVPALRRLTRPPPLALIENGRMLPRNMRQEMITREELMSQLRQQGVEDPAEVEKAFIEGDGRISIIKKSGGEQRESRSPLHGR